MYYFFFSYVIPCDKSQHICSQPSVSSLLIISYTNVPSCHSVKLSSPLISPCASSPLTFLLSQNTSSYHRLMRYPNNVNFLFLKQVTNPLYELPSFKTISLCFLVFSSFSCKSKSLVSSKISHCSAHGR